MYIAALFVLILAQGDLQPAATTPTSPAAAEGQEGAEEPDPEDEIVCRRERITGSNRPERICMTSRQWRQLRDRSLEEQRDQSQSSVTGRGEGESLGGR